eukprot:12132037-Karenia_brevis.AAC.1
MAFQRSRRANLIDNCREFYLDILLKGTRKPISLTAVARPRLEMVQDNQDGQPCDLISHYP